MTGRGLWCCAVLGLTLLQGLAEPLPLVEGIQSWQVFPRQGKVGAIAFRARGTGALVAELFRSGETTPLLPTRVAAHHNQLNPSRFS